MQELEEEMQKPEIWANQKKASELGTQIRDVKDNLEFLKKWQDVIDDTETALEIADEELKQKRCNHKEASFDNLQFKK